MKEWRMSDRLFPDDVLFSQRILSCCHLYTGPLNGSWDAVTDAADQEFYRRCDQIAGDVAKFDSRSERNIRTLIIEVQPLCRESLRKIRAAGLDARVISGTRTYAEQTALYRQGRYGNAGNIVTNAKAGQSWHNFGRAWDIGIFKNGAYVADGPEYAQAATHGKISKVEWGGDWTTFKDKPHYQVIGQFGTLTAVRNDFERGGR
jgi:peptidoglycan L-alanyl-D-glutamate endopeptidase CwlK